MSEEIKQVANEAADKVQEAAKDVVNKANEKLEAAKDAWAELARRDPDAARRQLRAAYMWIGVALVAGAFAFGFWASRLLQ